MVRHPSSRRKANNYITSFAGKPQNPFRKLLFFRMEVNQRPPVCWKPARALRNVMKKRRLLPHRLHRRQPCRPDRRVEPEGYGEHEGNAPSGGEAVGVDDEAPGELVGE